MRTDVARRLNALDNAFYRTQAQSFSETRQAPWPGWVRCLELVGEDAGSGLPDAPAEVRVLDVACGNLRFARFLARSWSGVRVAYDAVDACPELAGGWETPAGWQLSYTRHDVVRGLLDGTGGVSPAGMGGTRPPGGYDLVVCFGFLHHVPRAEARERLLRELMAAARPGGTCFVSLWRFLDDARLARKAGLATAEALADLGLSANDLDRGDRLLGWQGRPHVWRYCHGFDDAEVDGLVGSVVGYGGASVVARFRSDGRTGRLNEYLVLRRAR